MSESRLAHRERLRTKERFIVDTIFPAGALHVIGGPSGIGKTTWLLQSLHEWEQGKPILGFPSHPCKWVYVSLDRSLLDGDRTLRRIGLADWNIPMYSIEEICERDTVTKRITVEPDLFMVANRFEDVELIVVEGLQGFLPDIKRGQTQNKAEQLWMVKIRDEILNTGKTIIATTHSPKAEDNTKSANNRKAFLGSQAS
jgi:RecA-family ATPase